GEARRDCFRGGRQGTGCTRHAGAPGPAGPAAAEPRRRRARARLHWPVPGPRARRSMIASLRGRVRRRPGDGVMVESAGVGYEVVLPPIVAQGLDGLMAGDGTEGGGELELVIYYHATRDQPRPVLIGFAREVEREFFERLITVKDVGPLVAA